MDVVFIYDQEKTKMFWPRIKSVPRWTLRKVVHGASIYSSILCISTQIFTQMPPVQIEDMLNTCKIRVQMDIEKKKLCMKFQCMISYTEASCTTVLESSGTGPNYFVHKWNQCSKDFWDASYVELRWMVSYFEPLCSAFSKIHPNGSIFLSRVVSTLRWT